jgi:hypothetical protein
VSLFTLEIPASVRTGPYADDKIEAFCDALIGAAEPVQQRAITAYEACVSRADELLIANEWSAECERRLEWLAPETHPPVRELLPSGPRPAAPSTEPPAQLQPTQ